MPEPYASVDISHTAGYENIRQYIMEEREKKDLRLWNKIVVETRPLKDNNETARRLYDYILKNYK